MQEYSVNIFFREIRFQNFPIRHLYNAFHQAKTVIQEGTEKIYQNPGLPSIGRSKEYPMAQVVERPREQLN